MSRIEYVSHQSFTEDPYVKEVVYLCLEGKFRVLYCRKVSKNGGLFWTVPSVSASVSGAKQHFPAVMLDSNFLEADIKTFLEARSWDAMPTSMSEVAMADGLPF